MSSAASESAGSASGTSTTSSWPARTLYAGSTASPSARTWPSRASRAMALRESWLCAARKRSTRCPPSSTRSAIRSATLCELAGAGGQSPPIGASLLVPERDRHEKDADYDRRVGHVERPEADVADSDVDEVDDVALRHAVEEIAEGAAQLHPQCCRHERRVTRDPPVVIDDREDSDYREH